MSQTKHQTAPRQSRRRRLRRRRTRLMVAMLGAVGLLLLGLLVGYQMIRVYLHSEAFRLLLGEQAGKAMQSDVSVGALHWQGLSVHGDGFEAIGHDGSPIGELSVSNLRANIGLDGFSKGVWRVRDVRADRLLLDLAVMKDTEVDVEREPEVLDVADDVESEKKWWSGWLPDEVEFEEIEVREANLRFFASDTEMRLLGSGLRLKPRDPDGYAIEARGGDLRIIPFPGALSQDRTYALRDAWITIDQQGLVLSDSFLTGPDGETAQVSGTVPFDKSDSGNLRMDVNIRSLPVSAVLGPEWTSRVLGRLDIDATVDALPDETVVATGSVAITDARFETQGLIKDDGLTGGLLTTMRMGSVAMFETVMPVLGAYTEESMRFRNLVFNRASADFRHRKGHTRFTNIVLQSEGVLTVEGSLDIDEDTLDGYFQLGMTQQVLRRIPGAEQQVFTTERDGLLWAPVRLTGTMSSPREDLSGRLFAAAGGRIIEALPETTMALIQAAPNLIGGRDVFETGVRLLEQGGGALESVGGVVNGFLEGSGLPGGGIFPGSRPRETVEEEEDADAGEIEPPSDEPFDEDPGQESGGPLDEAAELLPFDR